MLFAIALHPTYMTKFSDIITQKTTSCSKCFSMLYGLPCQIDADIANFLKSFGGPIYPLQSVSLLKIDSTDGFHIEGRLGAKVIKFGMPKKYENSDLAKLKRKIEFELQLKKWLEKKLNIKIG